MNTEGIHRRPIETQNVKAVKNAVRQAVGSNSMVAVVAEIGSGKTLLYNHLADYWNQYPHRFRVVTMKGFDMRASRISGIMRMLIESINPAAQIPVQIERMYQALSAELRSFCKAESSRVILMIDEAQDLTRQTFRDIKKIHEIDGHGRDHLLSVVYFGKPHRKWDILLADPEIGFRTQLLILEKLTAEELLKIAEERYGLKFENTRARERFAASVRFKTPLGVEFFARALRQELYLGEDEPVHVTMELATRVPMLSLKFRVRQAGVKHAQIAKEAGKIMPEKSINNQRVSEVLNGAPAAINNEKLCEAVVLAAERLINDALSEKQRRISGEE